MGAKCRTGPITSVDMAFVVVILTIIVLFVVVAFGFVILQGTMLVPGPK